MKDRLYIKIVVLLLCITVLSAAVTALTAPKTAQMPPRGDGTVTVVTSFYPVYIAACNVAGGIDGVTVTDMVDSTAGCLHDIALTTEHLIALENADVFVMNGAGAESFLETALAERPALTVIDLSAGQSLLESEHMHTHEHEEEGHAHDGEAYNSHLWVSPRRYRQQVEALRDGLIAADPANEAAYTANAAAYLQQIDAAWARMQAAAAPLKETASLLFHDSLGYLAEDLGLTVVSALNVGEDSDVSAAQLSAAADALDSCDHALFWYDAQYSSVQYPTLQDIPEKATVLTVDTCVTGDGDPRHWLEAMTALCEALEAAA